MNKITMPPRIQFDQEVETAVANVFQYYREQNRDFGSKGFFEKAYADAFVDFQGGVGFAEIVSSGTASIFVALQALRLPQNSEILVSAITDPGMISPAILLGHKIRLVDNAPQAIHPNLEMIQGRVTKNTKCILLNHYSGKPIADIQEICAWARTEGIYVVEDCSQTHGGKVHGKNVGTFGDIACFSTMYSKTHSSGGQGGICYTRNADLYDQIRMCSSKGKPFHDPQFNEKNAASFQFPALNLNLNEISCAIGHTTLKRVPQVNQRRLQFLGFLEKLMLTSQAKTKLLSPLEGDAPFFAIMMAPGHLPVSKIEFAKKLMAEGLTLNPHYQYVVDEWDWVKPYLADQEKTPNARQVRDQAIHLLFNENFGHEEAEFICNSVLKVENHYGL